MLKKLKRVRLMDRSLMPKSPHWYWQYVVKREGSELKVRLVPITGIGKTYYGGSTSLYRDYDRSNLRDPLSTARSIAKNAANAKSNFESAHHDRMVDANLRKHGRRFSGVY
jgi:hypothetical protein